VRDIITRDLSHAVETEVSVNIILIEELSKIELQNYSSFCIDSLDVVTHCYNLNPDFLSIKTDSVVEETLHSNLLKSNCLITGQPDWGSIEISYLGKRISPEGLLLYIISYRNHHEFHEQCVERIFMDIMQKCQPEKLTIEARYTRRGGIDINPFRTTENNLIPSNLRQFRQ
jgi:7-cyano-7-deazaguanine reductase